jgi:hypothetical protein
MYFLTVPCKSSASCKQIPYIFFLQFLCNWVIYSLFCHYRTQALCSIYENNVAYCHGDVFTLCPAGLVATSASQLHCLAALFFSQSQQSITQCHSHIWLHNGYNNINYTVATGQTSISLTHTTYPYLSPSFSHLVCFSLRCASRKFPESASNL